MINTMTAAVPEPDDRSRRINQPWTRLTESGQFSIEQVIQAYYLSLINVAQDLIHPAMRSKITPADLVQDAILVAYARSEKLHGKSSQQLRIWLLSVLMNKYKQQRRNIKRHGEISLDELNPPSNSSSGSSNHGDQDPGSPQRDEFGGPKRNGGYRDSKRQSVASEAFRCYADEIAGRVKPRSDCISPEY